MDSRLMISLVLASFCFMYSDALTCNVCANGVCSTSVSCTAATSYTSTNYTAYCYYYSYSLFSATVSYSNCDTVNAICSSGGSIQTTSAVVGYTISGKCCATNLCNTSKAASVFPNKLALMVAAVCAIVFAKMHI